MKTIQEMACEAGFAGTASVFYMKELESFAALVREDERERIAKWYESEGHMMFPVAIPKTIRSNT